MSTKDEFEKINITGNIDNIVPYYYSEQQPQDLDKHWYFDYTNKPLPWQRYD